MFSEHIRAIKTWQIMSLARSRTTVNSPAEAALQVFIAFMTTSKSWFESSLFVCSHTTSMWPQCKKDKQMVNRWVLRPLWSALRVYSGDGLWRCSITPGVSIALMSRVFHSGLCVLHVKTRRWIFSPAHHPICIARWCLCAVLTLFFSKALHPWFAPLL